MPFIVYDAAQPPELPQSLSDLTNQQIQDLVDVYVNEGNALTMRAVLHYPRNVCQEAYTKLEAVRREMEQAILDNNDITAAECLEAVTTLDSVPTVQEYVCNQIVANACSEGTWVDFQASVIAYFA